MTDLEITRLCAEAMGVRNDNEGFYCGVPCVWTVECSSANHQTHRAFYPLLDDAQAMALVKKFRLYIDGDGNRSDYNIWQVECWPEGATEAGEIAVSQDLNHAICECVAQMRRAGK